MFGSKDYIDDIHQIPSQWILWKYFDLPESLLGETIRIKSYFNLKETKPSMFLFYNTSKQKYFYKDFSTGKGGSIIDLLLYIKGVSFKDLVNLIIEDYAEFLKSGQKLEDITSVGKWKVTDHEIRTWNKLDADYWSAYNINSYLLERYCVKPLKSFTMSKIQVDGTVIQQFKNESQYLYGYFSKYDVLHKIYQPKKPEMKFIKIGSLLQGEEQLEGNDVLIIASSLKDGMCVKSIPLLRVDIIAPDSETIILPEEKIEEFILKYKAIVTLFDNDEPGIKSMKEYKKRFSIPYVYIPKEKDIAELIKTEGWWNGLVELKPKLDIAIEKFKEIYTQ